jgi:sigma-B regulation protein RsbU (phosphoserine phosphatase)
MQSAARLGHRESGSDVLVVDDDARILSALRRVLSTLEIEVEATDDPTHAVEILGARPPRVIIVDYHMPRMDGVALLREARRLAPDTIRILLTAGADSGQIIEAINVGRIFRFVAKPWDDEALVALVGDAIEAHQMRRRQETAEAERLALRTMLRGVRKLQLELYPAPHITLETGEVACASAPCEHATGDYLDVLRLGRNRTALLVGDVSGHGVEAAFFVFAVRALMRWGLGEAGALGEIVARANRILCRDMTGGRFLTLFAAVHDAKAGRLDYVNAGHLPPFVVDNRGVRELERGGLPLGLVDDVRPDLHSIELSSESLLFAFTDGVTEARDEGGSFFGS